jgi:CRP-like cAMP-binding protein
MHLAPASFNSSLTLSLLRSPTLQFQRKKLLTLRPDCLWKIEKGYVRSVTWTEAGEVTTLGVWGAGDMVGRPLSRLKCYQLECLTEVTAQLIPTSTAEAQAACIRYTNQTEIMLQFMHIRSTSQRLLKLLYWLAARFGTKVDRGYLIDVPLTHQLIAEMLGTTRVTVTRMLNEFTQKGKICPLPRRKLLILCADLAPELTEFEF